MKSIEHIKKKNRKVWPVVEMALAAPTVRNPSGTKMVHVTSSTVERESF